MNKRKVLIRLAELQSLPGEVVSLMIDSEALGGPKKVNVYLPGAYGKTHDRYPVVYLLRGHEREWVNPNEDDSRGGRTAATIADELIRDGKISPVILVMPELASEDYFVKELIPAIDREYRTLAERRYRAVDGFSLGGFSSLSIALRHPELFSSVGAYDGTFLYENATCPDGSPDGLANNGVFAPALGSPLDMNNFRKVNPADLIASLPVERLKQLRFHIHSGPEAAEPNANFFRTRAVVSKLKERGIPNSFEPFVIDGASHNWHWADEHLKLALAKHAEVFAGKAE